MARNTNICLKALTERRGFFASGEENDAGNTVWFAKPFDGVSGAPTRQAAWGEEEPSRRLRATNGSPKQSGSCDDKKRPSPIKWFSQI